jgi:biotin carboxyl carrier protein
MKLTLQLEGDSFEVDVERTTKGLRVECEGETVEFEAATFDSTVELSLGGKLHRVRFVSEDTVQIDGAVRRFRLSKFVPGSPASLGGDGAQSAVRASMPGRIVKVLREPGADIVKGDPLFVLEAMKMQNELASPLAGKISEILVKPGDVVEAGRVLAKVATPARKG